MLSAFGVQALVPPSMPFSVMLGEPPLYLQLKLGAPSKDADFQRVIFPVNDDLGKLWSIHFPVSLWAVLFLLCIIFTMVYPPCAICTSGDLNPHPPGHCSVYQGLRKRGTVLGTVPVYTV